MRGNERAGRETWSSARQLLILTERNVQLTLRSSVGGLFQSSIVRCRLLLRFRMPADRSGAACTVAPSSR